MKRSNPCRVAVIVTLLSLLAVPAFADQRWVELQPGRSGEAPVIEITEFADGIVVEMDTAGFFADAVEAEEKTYTALSIPECGRHGPLGEPSLPFRYVLLPIANGPAAVIASVTTAPVTALEDLLAMPAQQPPPDCGPPSEPPFSCNRKAYDADAWFPAQPARIAAEVVVRGQRFLQLEMSPLQYNPARKELRAHPHMEATISLQGAVNQAAEALKLRRAKSSFPTLIDIEDGSQLPDSNPTGIEYLIITHDDFLAEVAPLADWKRLKGFTVEVVPISAVGSTATAIEGWLQTRYDSDPDLTYVLLVGDHQQIPAKIVSGHATDLYYSCLEGSDYFPDVVIGRISVQTPTDCANVIDKTLAHDRSPDGGSWRGDFLMAAKFEDYYSPTCEADRFFFETGTHAMHYVRDHVGMGIYTAATSESLSCNPWVWRADNPSWYPHRPPGYGGGVPVPPDDAALFTSGSVATQDVTDAINAGVSIVQHRDHGGETSWGEPHYTNSNINALANGTRTPVVFSVNCLTGTFNAGSDCFAEAFMKKYPGGAVGVIAASDVSYSGHNDLLVHGAFDCMWDPYDPADGGNIYPHSFRPAEAFLYGKYYMYNWEGAGSTTLIEFEMFHWHGDPELTAFTSDPVSPTVILDPTLPVGATDLTVTCDAEGATVAVTDGGQLLGRGLVSGGAATITLDPVPGSPGTLDVVVTGHNLLPWEGTVEVITPSGPWMVFRTCVIDDTAGNADGILNPGESAVMPVSVENVGADGGTGISGALASGSPNCTVTDGSADFPDAAVGAIVQSLPNHYSFNLDGTAVHGQTVPFMLDWVADGGHSGSTAFAVPVCEQLVISDVTVSEITAVEAVVRWTTNVPATSTVLYGTTPPLTGILENTALVTQHELTIEDLDECTDYRFEVSSLSPGCYEVSDNNGGTHYRFTTHGRTVFAEEALDTDPGWAIDNGGNGHGWAFGQPQGLGGEYGQPDPSAGFSGSNVYGVNLAGDYDNNLVTDQLRLETMSFDLNKASTAKLSFMRWLCVEQPSYDHARIQVSVDGGAWTTVWENTATIDGGSWEEVELDLTALAAYQTDVRLRWTIGATDSSWRYCGWNLDDIVLEGATECENTSDIFADGFESGDTSAWSLTVD